MRFLLLFILLAISPGIFPDDGEKKGRQGNEHYAQEHYNLAAKAYAEGLASLGDGASAWVRYALENNRGAALLRAGNVEGAREAFGRALASSPTPADAARTSYNAGNAAFSAQDLQKALAHYRDSLLRDPANEDAKFNYEFVKRRLEQQEQQNQQQSGDNQNQDRQNEQDRNSQGDQNQDPQQQDQQQEDGGQQQQDGRQDEQENQPSPQQAPTNLSDEQAERILQALQNEEEQLLRQVQRQDARPRRVEKDW